MEQILLAYGLPKEIVTALMRLYKNTKAIVYSPNVDTDFFYKVTGVYTLPRLCTLNVDRSNKRRWFHIKKDKKQMISTEIMTDTDDLALLTNTPAQAESLLHSLKQKQ